MRDEGVSLDTPDVPLDGATDGRLDADEVTIPDAAVDAGVCSGQCAWSLSGSRWTPSPIDGAFAPTSPIRCAFDMEGLDLIYLLTDTTYHVFRPSEQTFTEAGTRNSIMPEASAMLVVAAYGAPRGGPETQIVVTADLIAQLYAFDHATGTFTHSSQVTDFGTDWAGPNAPPRSMIQAAWQTLDNSAEWALDSDACEVTGGYAAFISNTTVYPRDFGDCRIFLDPVSYTDFMPFALTTAPASDGIVAASYHDDQLWLFTQ